MWPKDNRYAEVMSLNLKNFDFVSKTCPKEYNCGMQLNSGILLKFDTFKIHKTQPQCS